MTERLTVPVELERGSYRVDIGTAILDDPQSWGSVLGDETVLLVSNDTVAPLYADRLESALGERDVHRHIIPDGEPHKNVSTWSGIIDRLIEIRARRDATLIALGGGVVGDICGFAAASYMRGIRFVQVPTTLLAQVDASVGGKTGINHTAGKNLIGAFHQPAAVIIDTATLDTLPRREYLAGLAEVVKYGAIMDAEFLDRIESMIDAVTARDPEVLRELVARSVRNKAKVVSADEREGGIRAILNFGHTFGHAIESVTGYARYLHGEAVAIGMVMAASLSERRGLCEAGTAARLERLLAALGLTTTLPDDIATAPLIETMGLDKKAVAGGLRLVLLTSTGEAVIDQDSSETEIAAAIDACRDPSRAI
ncbi:3-dehydroquinate synthase [Elongatibacter sediminis]|uniref:3-dehydroquinate synthase n=1 Tax=Elongatibacter sediminis TaxID=3119006 RepID=A0AAW9RKT9_9GAMM